MFIGPPYGAVVVEDVVDVVEVVVVVVVVVYVTVRSSYQSSSILRLQLAAALVYLIRYAVFRFRINSDVARLSPPWFFPTPMASE